MLLGLGLMTYPYFVENTMALFGLGLAGTVIFFLLGE